MEQSKLGYIAALMAASHNVGEKTIVVTFTKYITTMTAILLQL
jgi:hypothetical protein